jgi:hypothetical protein
MAGVALLGIAIGGAAVLIYWRAGLTLSHYDAKAHLVVARRVLDTITPGWQQIGGVWLPLPHLLNLLPVQVDAFYRSGASAIAISMAGFTLAGCASAWIVGEITGSRPAALAGALVLFLNPNVLYLQATPMTEPLLLGLTTAAVALLYRWTREEGRASVHPVGLGFAAACWTRYEAWPVTGLALALACLALLRRGVPWRAAIGRLSGVALYPAAAFVSFLFLSWGATGEWLVSGGFYVPDNVAAGNPVRAVVAVGWGVNELAGRPLVLLGVLGVMVRLASGALRPDRAPALLVLGLTGAAALPWYAFYEGHPFRIRYMVPLLVPAAVFAAVFAGSLPRRFRTAAAVAVVAVAVTGRPPFAPEAPMVQEAQWDVPNSRARQAVTACLARDRDGEKILASMGSLAHYMQETSRAGFAIRDFIHEGNGDFWTEAVAIPWRHAGWILIEERAEGGDVLAARSRSDPLFLARYERICEGGGVALYRRR